MDKTGNTITKNELKTILILFVLDLLFLGCIFVFIKNVYCLLISLCLFGFIISLFLKAKNENFKIISKDFGIELLFAVIIPSLTIFIPSFIQQCEVFYFNKNEEIVVNFETKKNEVEKKPYRFIFAFDNSGGKHFTEPVSELSKFDFKDKIKGYLNQNKDAIHDSCFNQPVNYKNLLIERLCYDLINLEDNYEFRLMKIGDPQNPFDDRGWQFANPERKINKIKLFFKTDRTKIQEQNTDFYHFYKDLEKITNDNYIYVLFVYSDFVHDIKENKQYPGRLSNFQAECDEIKKIQGYLIQKNIIQYLFYAPYPNKPDVQYEQKILPCKNEGNDIFHFPINTAYTSLKINNITHEIGNFTMLISDNPEEIAISSLLIIFKDKGNIVRIQNDKNKNFTVYKIDDNGQEEQYIYDRDKELTTNIIRIKSKKDDETVKLEITENNIKYSVSFHFGKKLTPIIGWVIIPLVSIFVGVVIGTTYLIIKKWIKSK